NLSYSSVKTHKKFRFFCKMDVGTTANHDFTNKS
ncbi:hypothetical protein LEP1GSC150_4182, partial [Leptospira interrogans serovar Copenhageni str. LT2050]